MSEEHLRFISRWFLFIHAAAILQELNPEMTSDAAAMHRLLRYRGDAGVTDFNITLMELLRYCTAMSGDGGYQEKRKTKSVCEHVTSSGWNHDVHVDSSLVQQPDVLEDDGREEERQERGRMTTRNRRRKRRRQIKGRK